MTDSILIRIAHNGDEQALARLAKLDSARPLNGPVLVAETAGGTIDAALSVSTGAAIADPFKPTAALVELLRVNAAGVRARRRGVRRLTLAATGQ